MIEIVASNDSCINNRGKLNKMKRNENGENGEISINYTGQKRREVNNFKSNV